MILIGCSNLNDQSSDGNQGQNQHVKNEELLTIRSCWINVVTSNSPHSVLHALAEIVKVYEI